MQAERDKMKNMRSTVIPSILLIIITACSPGGNDKGSITEITPESQGISSQAILNLIDGIESERKDEVHSFILLRHGKKIAEAYWDPYNPDSPHMLFSLSKSFTATAIGIAQDEGLLSIYDPVISFFPESLPDSISPNLRAMRIWDLLRMSTGHQNDATGRMRMGDGSWVSNFLSLPVEHKPGTHFVYNTAATYMLSAILQEASGETLINYLTPRLFDPLEINDPSWEVSPEGINTGGYGLNVRTRDIANFGQLYLQKGRWNDRQLVSEAWVNEASSIQTSNGSNPESDWDQGYGYQFWQCRNGLYRGDGAYGQFCIVMPDQDAVIAITSGTRDMQAIMNLVWEHILPAFHDAALDEDPENYNQLKERISQLSMSLIEGEETSSVEGSVSDKIYVLEPNEYNMESMTFHFNRPDKSIMFTSPEEVVTLPVGFKSMSQGMMLYPGFGMQPVASSGAWISENHYRVRMYYYETPFHITMNLIFEEDILTADFDMNLGSGSQQQMPALKGKVRNDR